MDCQKSKGKKLLKQRVEFSTKNQIETMDILTKSVGQKKC